MARHRNSSKNPTTPKDVVSAPLAAVVPVVPPENQAPPRVDRLGVDLGKARNALGLTPRQVEEVLRVKEEYLLALENGHYHLLPTTAHAKGFLRSYAQFLGLSAQLESFQARFIEETQNLPLAPQLVMPAALPEAKLPTLKFIAGGVGAALLVALLYVNLSAPLPAPPTPPGPLVAETPSTAVAAPTPTAETPAAATASAPIAETPPAAATEQQNNVPQGLPTPNKQGVTIRAVDNVWVQVQDKTGATIFSRLLRQDEEIPAPEGDGLTLTAGNGAGIQLVLNGQATRVIGAKAEVVRGVALDAKKVEARLKAPLPKPAVPKPAAPKPLATIAPAPTDAPAPAATPTTEASDTVNEE